MIFIALGIRALIGFSVMLISFVDRPKDNDSGVLGSFGQMGQEWHPRLPPGNDK
jgi:hypothetical protein